MTNVLPPHVVYRREWAQRLICKAAEVRVPSYASPGFLRLPEGSAAMIASVVRAAECWARDGDDLEERLHLEVDEAARAWKAAEDAEYVASIAAHREQWRHLQHMRPLAPNAIDRAGAAASRDLYDIGHEYMEERRWA